MQRGSSRRHGAVFPLRNLDPCGVCRWQFATCCFFSNQFPFLKGPTVDCFATKKSRPPYHSEASKTNNINLYKTILLLHKEKLHIGYGIIDIPHNLGLPKTLNIIIYLVSLGLLAYISAARKKRIFSREDIFARGYFREKIFSREDIFAGRYFYGKKFSREQYIRENIFSRKYLKFIFREIFFPRK